jgi:transcriptional regulator with XRE-family HTH domain
MIHKALKLIRTIEDKTLNDIATKYKISSNYLSEIESGKKYPTWEILNMYALEFSLHVSDIILLSEKLCTIKNISDQFIRSIK